MKLIRTFVLIPLILFFNAATAQDLYKILDSISGKMITDIRVHENEKVLISTDKNIYSAGDKIWFRAFLLHSISQKISTKSKNIFVVLVNNKDSIVNKLLLNAHTQQLSGELLINKNLPSGYYWLKAYTGEIAANNPQNASITNLYIIRPGEKIALAPKGNLSSFNKIAPQLIFYPEGGSIISGANTSIGFRVIAPDNKPIKAYGQIRNNKDTTTIPFLSDQYGLGMVSFFPSRHKSYTAYLNYNGKQFAFPLPAFNFFAGQIAAVQENGSLKKLQIFLEDSIYNNNANTFLIGITNDSLSFASTGRGMYEVAFTPHQFKDGITTFYLFDNNKKLLSERSVYINEKAINVGLLTDKQVYPKRSKAQLTISVSDYRNLPIPASVAVSVVNKNVAPQADNEQLINSYFTPGKSMVFDNQLFSQVPLKDIDILMMSRNLYNKLITISPSALYDFSKEENLLNIKGHVVSSQPADKVVTLISTSGNITFSSDTSKADGHFIIPAKNYSDSTDFTIQVKTLRGRNLDDKVIILPVVFPKINGLLDTTLILSEEDRISTQKLYANIFENDPKVKYLKPIEESSRKKTFDDIRRKSSNSKIITSEMMEQNHSSSVENAVLNLPGVQVIGGYVTIGGLGGSIPSPRSEPLIMFNGSPIITQEYSPGESSPVLSYLRNLNSKEIDFIEVLSGSDGAAFGVRGGNGVILINSSSTDKSKPGEVPLRSFMADGYYRSHPYPAPDYAQSGISEKLEYDNRTTLYYNGNLVTDANGKINVPFYTSDIPGIYNIIIKGITVHGDPVFSMINIKVE